MKRYQEIPRDTKRYRYQEIQEIPFGRRYTNGIPLVSFGISWYLWGGRCCRDTKRYQRDTVGIPPSKRYLLVSLGISWYLCCPSRRVSHLGFRLRLMLATQAYGFSNKYPGHDAVAAIQQGPHGLQDAMQENRKMP